MPPSPIVRSSTRSTSRAATTSSSSRPTSPSSKPNWPTPSATIPPSIIAALPGTPEQRAEPADLRRAEDIDKGHGRIEVRRIAVRTVLPARLAENWPGLQQICRIERFRETKQLGSRQVIYAITDLPVLPGSAAALLALARGHWQIENRLFHVRDTTFAEDACRFITRAPP